jgi:NitT/TauT family transport system substrate-binding protein
MQERNAKTSGQEQGRQEENHISKEIDMKARNTLAIVLAWCLSTLAATGAAAETKITLGYTGVTDFTAAFVAKEEGYFKKRGLDVELQLIALNSTIPAALQSDSIQVGGPTSSVMIQAVDGGLDLVAIAGSSVTSKKATNYGLIARAGSNIKTPQDLIGKKVGAPGLGAFLHVLFRKWLMDNGVDYKKVTFIEVPFPQMNEVLRSGNVDAVVTGDPIKNRILKAGTGYLVSHYAQDLPDGQLIIPYAVTRDWASKNPAAVTAFRAAITEGVDFTAKNPEAARMHMGKYIKMPPEVLATLQISDLRAEVTEAQMQFWVNVMREQSMLKGSPNPVALIAK